jgi:hypothetical protein
LPAQRQRLLLDRARFLLPEDRDLVEASAEQGLTVRELATQTSRSAGQIARRLVSLQRRLTDPRVVTLLHAAETLSSEDREVALGFFVRKQRVADIALSVDLTPAVVRQRLHFIRGWLQGVRDGVHAFRRTVEPL